MGAPSQFHRLRHTGYTGFQNYTGFQTSKLYRVYQIPKIYWVYRAPKYSTFSFRVQPAFQKIKILTRIITASRKKFVPKKDIFAFSIDWADLNNEKRHEHMSGFINHDQLAFKE